MKRNVLLIAVGILAFFSFLVAKAPAALLTHFLPDTGEISARAPEGTLWSGRFGQLQVGPLSMGPVEWDLRKTSLALLRVDADIEARVGDGQVSGRAILGTGGRIEIREAVGQRLPISQLATLFGQPPGVLAGEAAFDLPLVSFREFTPWSGEGQIRVFDLQANIMGMTELGNFGGEAHGNEGEFRIDFNDAGDDAPFALQGQLLFQAETQHYQIEGRIRARDHAPSNLAGGLDYLGQPDEDGYYPVSFDGRL